MDIIVLILVILTFKLYLKHARHFTYDSYIHSAEWRRKRIKALLRDGYKCTECGSKNYLHVHHLSYAHFGHERLYELTTLCRNCHKNRHK